MKLHSSLLASSALLAACCLAPQAQAQAQGSNDSKLAKYQHLASRNNGVVPLTSALYDELVGDGSGPNSISSSERDFSVSVILTALSPRFGCGPCLAFDKEHRQVASQWWNKSENKKDKKKQLRHIFAVLDFEKGQEVFKRMGLTTAPLGQLFLPSQAKPVPYDFNKHGVQAEPFAAFLSQVTGQPITFSRPLDYSKVATATSVIIAVASVTFFFWRYVKLFVLSRWLWATASLLFILPMISGYMWNQIRKPPSMQMSKEGKAIYIASGYSNQFSVETQIISVVYGILAFSTYTLAVTLPNMSHETLKQRVGVYLWLGVLVVMASVLVSIFQVKNPSYPFKLLF